MSKERARILLCLCHMGGREMEYISQAVADNWVVPLGPNVTAFENEIACFLKKNSTNHQFQSADLHQSDSDEGFEGKSCVALSSGTAAVHMGLLAAGVGKGDEVMVQSFTFSATANPVVYLGATPVFVDSEPQTWNMDPALLDSAIADRVTLTGKKPKAIIPVHLYGMPARMNEILSVAARWEIPVVEDAAEALGSSYRSQECGTFGRFGALSFNGNKMITTSGGGMLVCPDEQSAASVLKYATQSREPVPWYEHKDIGFNYRMSNICAGIGRGQMHVLEEHIVHHRRIHKLYKELFADLEEIRVHDNPSPEFDSNFWLTTVTFSSGARIYGAEGDQIPETLRRKFEGENIETRHLWKPMHLQPYFSACPAYVNKESENLFRSGLCLPSGPWVGEEEARLVAAVIRRGIGAK